MQKLRNSVVFLLVAFSAAGYDAASAATQEESMYPVFIAVAMIVGGVAARVISKKSAKAS